MWAQKTGYERLCEKGNGVGECLQQAPKFVLLVFIQVSQQSDGPLLAARPTQVLQVPSPASCPLSVSPSDWKSVG